MLTTDKQIATPEYWDSVFKEENKTSVVDNLTVKRVPQLDRLGEVIKLITDDEINVLDIASAHATLCKRLAALHPKRYIVASDHSPEAEKLAKYHPYRVFSAYDIPYQLTGENKDQKPFDLVICTQAMEYMEDNDKFLTEAKRVGKALIVSVPKGEMANWSQLRIYTEENVRELLSKYGKVQEPMWVYKHMILAKVIFE